MLTALFSVFFYMSLGLIFVLSIGFIFFFIISVIKYINPGTRIVTLDAEHGFLVELTNKRSKQVTIERFSLTARAGTTGAVGNYQTTNLSMAPHEKKMIVIPITKPLTSRIGGSLYCDYDILEYNGLRELAFTYTQTVTVSRNDPAYSCHFMAPPPYVIGTGSFELKTQYDLMPSPRELKDNMKIDTKNKH